MYDSQFTVRQGQDETMSDCELRVEDCGLSRNERLKSEIEISSLFRSGDKGFVYPFKYLILKSGDEMNKILISVPKRNFKHAVDRNRMKRLVREAYRLNKNIAGHNGLSIAFIYIAKSLVDYKTVEVSIKTILNQCESHNFEVKH